jgi:hypothetical protein
MDLGQDVPETGWDKMFQPPVLWKKSLRRKKAKWADPYHFQRFSVSAFQRFSVSAFQRFSVSAFQRFSVSAFQRFSVYLSTLPPVVGSARMRPMTRYGIRAGVAEIDQ